MSHSLVTAKITQDIEDKLKQFLHLPAKDISGRQKKSLRQMLISYGYQAGLMDRQEKPENLKKINLLNDLIEDLHEASLVIDDIEDESNFRRGEPSLHVKYGLPTALNTANWIYFRSLEKIMFASEFDDLLKNKILSWTLLVMRQAHEGQALDLNNLMKVDLPQIPDENFYKYITELKTGALTGLAAGLASMLSNSDDERFLKYFKIGQTIGVFIQQLNDIGNIEKRISNQNFFEDARNKKISWVNYLAPVVLPPSTWSDLEKLILNSVNPNDLSIFCRQNNVYEVLRNHVFKKLDEFAAVSSQVCECANPDLTEAQFKKIVQTLKQHYE